MESEVPMRSRVGLVFKAHRLLCHSTLGLIVIKKKNSSESGWRAFGVGVQQTPLRSYDRVSCARPYHWAPKIKSISGSKTATRWTMDLSSKDDLPRRNPLYGQVWSRYPP